MTCDEVRDLVLEHHARRLPTDLDRALEAHLATCVGCGRVDRAERGLTELLAARLPRHPAPAALVHRIARLAPGAAQPPGVIELARRRPAWAAGALAAAAAALLAVGLWTGLASGGRRGEPLATEAVNNHLRVLIAQRPLEIESGGLHQVKPWFEGKLDFAPLVPDLAPAGLVLRGGAVGWFHDRRAAVLQYQLRAHLVTLMEFRPDGLPLAETPRLSAEDRGFHAIVWRGGAIGYALIADVDPHELERVAAQVAPGTR